MKQKQLLIYFSLLITLSYAGYVPQWVVSVRSQHDANVVATENGLINKGKVCHMHVLGLPRQYQLSR